MTSQTTVPTTTQQLRQAFLDYFASKQHQIVSSSSLIPANDPTLLFTNAGMVQFKETFLGQEKRNYQRATSCQRCVRAGGKHNDLENVGYTARHHTFFEMLGNFSFGDYFKREAIAFAWEFLTETLKLPTDKLWVTVFRDDDEAAAIWIDEIGVDPARLTRCGEKDNFWSMGDTGPCGPCTEIFYDHGPEVAGGPPGTPEEDGDRYIEIWNLVFMQYDRDNSGTLNPLPKPSVDTGMGLERLAAVMQGVHSNYEIDLFQNLLKAIANMAEMDDHNHASIKVIADHIRSSAFLVVDGIVPANEGRGYVLRRIIRRALRHGHKLGLNDRFFYRLVAVLDAEMGEAYPELHKAKDLVARVLKQEEERFAETLDHGMKILEQAIGELSAQEIPGSVVFKLYDTYGFPVDLTADIARERSLSLDMPGFESAMEAQRQRARAASQFEGNWDQTGITLEQKTKFTGYDALSETVTIAALFHEQQAVDCLHNGQQGQIVLDSTPFYAESGGQVGDTGLLSQGDTQFKVLDTQKSGDAFIHLGQVQGGDIKVGDSLSAQVDGSKRDATARNHSATHLLHAALREILGDHVQQKGSLVDPQRLRFDFSHFEAIHPEQLQQIEQRVNQEILKNIEVKTQLMSLEAAKDSGAMALFGEKYADDVRVLSMGAFSVELCGGIHVNRIGDIGLFKISSESGVAAGVRRIEAITGLGTQAWVEQTQNQVNTLAQLLKTTPDALESRVQQLLEQLKSNEKTLKQLQDQLNSNQGSDLAGDAVEVNGVKVLAAHIKNADVKTLRDLLDQLKNKLGSAAIVLATVKGDKITLVAGVTKAETGKIKAGALVNFVAQQVGGKGGGRPDMAQAGGNQPQALDGALKSVVAWVQDQ
ncbi:alanine--tRNA ligase [Candidatus Venteria ishoeyi]|uniref:alanine--tRNA ligase n=1 Tax=Candidatus Venteria ishoeyi TaxID=1899563 RepID=UPI0025A503F2|nr:alanine--tRNA ligase [Candidatus Venteria ishoeyi]MDM8546340.1 alanine--tRNA ligase [Candidatus Venteria ishoeyi]